VVADSGGTGAARAAGGLSPDGRAAQQARGLRRVGRLNEPRAALVESHADGTPRRVNRQGVSTLREEWRVVDRWWTEEPVARRYFDVVLESGENAVVFRDEERASWFTQRA
jgi:hypothetical protein